MLTLRQSHIEAIYGTVDRALRHGLLIRKPGQNERPNVVIVDDTRKR